MTTEDGTGIVHVAPAYGEDDLKLGQRYGLPVLHAVGEDGYFLAAVTPVAGKFFKDADPTIIEILRERGLLFRAQKYLHNYPFGWRTGDPLIYYAKNAWYIRTTEYRQRMVELNRGIKWVPEHIREGRFGNWLENNIDWALSRERFWGTPLPLWTDGDGNYICIGSVAELEQRAGRKLGGDRPAPPGHRRRDVHARGPRVPPRRGGHRLLVRLGRHAVRAVALPLRESRRIRGELSGRFHLRGDRSDARVVLHAARDRDDGVRSGGLQERHLPEPHRRSRRQEDVEVAGQHHQPLRRVQRRGRGCAALALHGARRARRAEARLGRDHRRRREQLHQHVLEHVRVLRDVRAARRLRSQGAGAVCAAPGDRSLGLVPARADDRDRDGGARRLRCPARRRCDRELRGPAQQLVRAPQPPAFLESGERQRQAGGVPHALRVPRGRQPPARAVRAVHQRGRPSESRSCDRAGSSRQRAHGGMAGKRRAAARSSSCSTRPPSCSAS